MRTAIQQNLSDALEKLVQQGTLHEDDAVVIFSKSINQMNSQCPAKLSPGLVGTCGLRGLPARQVETCDNVDLAELVRQTT